MQALSIQGRPLISAAVNTSQNVLAAADGGYIIGGRRHKSGCRCYACRVVRMRGRERAIRKELFNCG